MIPGVGSYAQAAALKSPLQSNPSFEQQNTQEQKASSNIAQPREAEIAESIASDNDNTTSARQEREETETRRSSEDRGSNVDISV